MKELTERLIELLQEIDVGIEEGNVSIWTDEYALIFEELKDGIYKLDKELSK